jgi:hypothetical protein
VDQGADTGIRSDWGDDATVMAMRYDHVRIAKLVAGPQEFAEVAKQTAQLRRTTKVLIALLLLVGTGFTWMQLDGRRRARELALLQAHADSLIVEARDMSSRYRSELLGVRDALRAARDETARLRRELEAPGGDANQPAAARVVDAAERRQRAIAMVDYRAISHKNVDAVATCWWSSTMVTASAGRRSASTDGDDGHQQAHSRW